MSTRSICLRHLLALTVGLLMLLCAGCASDADRISYTDETAVLSLRLPEGYTWEVLSPEEGRGLRLFPGVPGESITIFLQDTPPDIEPPDSNEIFRCDGEGKSGWYVAQYEQSPAPGFTGFALRVTDAPALGFWVRGEARVTDARSEKILPPLQNILESIRYDTP